MWGPMERLVARKYYMDDLYERLIVRDGCTARLRCSAVVRRALIDFAVNGAGRVTRKAGDGLRWVQSGSVQAYGSSGSPDSCWHRC